MPPSLVYVLLQVNQCVRNSNTFAFVGDLEKSPEVSCVYHSEDAENQFVRNPKRAAMGDGVQVRTRSCLQKLLQSSPSVSDTLWSGG